MKDRRKRCTIKIRWCAKSNCTEAWEKVPCCQQELAYFVSHRSACHYRGGAHQQAHPSMEQNWNHACANFNTVKQYRSTLAIGIGMGAGADHSQACTSWCIFLLHLNHAQTVKEHTDEWNWMIFGNTNSEPISTYSGCQYKAPCEWTSGLDRKRYMLCGWLKKTTVQEQDPPWLLCVQGSLELVHDRFW